MRLPQKHCRRHLKIINMLTQKHVSRLKKVSRLLGEEGTPQKCDAMEGLTKEAHEWK